MLSVGTRWSACTSDKGVSTAHSVNITIVKPRLAAVTSDIRFSGRKILRSIAYMTAEKAIRFRFLHPDRGIGAWKTCPSLRSSETAGLHEKQLIQIAAVFKWSTVSIGVAFGLSGNVLVSINVVTLCWARLVPGWVTVLEWVNTPVFQMSAIFMAHNSGEICRNARDLRSCV